MTVVTPARSHSAWRAGDSVMEARGAAREAATATSWTSVLILLEAVGYTSADGKEMSKYLHGQMGVSGREGGRSQKQCA